MTVFGVLNALAISLGKHSAASLPGTRDIIARLPLVVFWLWINLLPFNISNQCQKSAILEDACNKPWRPMPSGRMTERQAKLLTFGLYPTALCISLWLSGLKPCVSLMLLGYGYNDLNLSDVNWVTRNLLNALGFCGFAWGALEAALGRPLVFQQGAIIVWLGVIAVVVFSTIQVQDMYDQEGDGLRSRKTLPLTIGDGPARWAIAAPMVAWSVLCPQYWRLGNGSRMLVGVLGLAVVCRTLAVRTVKADKLTFIVWNVWMAALYTLPLLAALGNHQSS